MDREKLAYECLWMVSDNPMTTEELAEEFNTEREEIEQIKDSGWFIPPFDREDGKWELSVHGKTYIEAQEVGIDEIRSIVIENFSEDVWKTTDICLSVISTLLLSDISNPTGLNLVGPPSDNKTTVLSFFYGIDGITIKSDNFTPKAFVSHASNVSQERLEQIDLLPRMRHKCFIVPELAPIFGKRKEDLIENISILTRVFDGEGYESDSGLRGHRGYTGDYMFTWLGATTPFSYTVWKTMGKMGMRWVFLNTSNKERDNQKLASMLTIDKPFKEKIKSCRRPVRRLMRHLWRNGIRSVTWDKKADSPKIIETLVKFAKLLSVLRAVIDVYWHTDAEGNSSYSYNISLCEQPERVLTILYNIARGHAIVHGRRSLDISDLEVVWDIICSSMPKDRSGVFSLLVHNGGYVNQNDVKKSLKCSGTTAKKIMKSFSTIEVANYQEFDDGTHGIELRPEHSWIYTWRQDLSRDKS